MADDVSIRFTADVSSLQDGMRQAAGTVRTTTSALRSGAEQISASFGSISQAYANSTARNAVTAQRSGDAELTIARQNDQAQYDIAVNGVKERSSLIKQQAQIAQISHEDELAGLLSLDGQRESIELRHLQFVQSTFQQGTTAYASAQRRIDELASQSALKRLEIEKTVTQQIYNDYRRSFDQIGSSVSSSIMGMIAGHVKLRDAARNVLTEIVQMFIQNRIKTVAEWLAGIAAQTAAVQAGEAAKTSAVIFGVAARTGAEQAGAAASSAAIIPSILKSIVASAAETFAGIFGFLAPVLGPAAAGPAAAGEAAVLGVAGGLAVGAWQLPRDMIVQAHAGEMVVPAGVTPWAQGVLSGAATQGTGGASVHVHHAANFNISTLDARSFESFLKGNGKRLMRTISESVRMGAHLGMSRL